MLQPAEVQLQQTTAVEVVPVLLKTHAHCKLYWQAMVSGHMPETVRSGAVQAVIWSHVARSDFSRTL
jgi:hypothetical protein